MRTTALRLLCALSFVVPINTVPCRMPLTSELFATVRAAFAHISRDSPDGGGASAHASS